jgi:hypothetical protein
VPDVLDVRSQHRLRLTVSGSASRAADPGRIRASFGAGRPHAAGNQVHKKTKRALPHGAS